MATGRTPRKNEMITNLVRRNPRANSLDDARTFVSKDKWETIAAIGTTFYAQISVAYAQSEYSNENLVRPWIVNSKLPNRSRFAWNTRNCSTCFCRH